MGTGHSPGTPTVQLLGDVRKLCLGRHCVETILWFGGVGPFATGVCHTAGLQTEKDRHTTSEETAALTSHPVQPHVHSATARHNSFLHTVILLTRNRVESDTRVTRVPDVSCSAASQKQWLLLLPSVALLPCALCVRLLQLIPSSR